MNKEEYKKTDLGYLPLDWNTKRIEDICEILDSKRIPLNKEQRDNMKGDIPYYGANGVVDYINDYLFDEDLILMAEDGGYFDEYRTRHIAYKVKGKSWVNNHAHVLKVLDSQTYEFIYYTLVHKNILPFINGGTRAKLNQADLKKILIQYPPLKEQQKIAEILSSVDAAIEKTEQVIAKTEEVKKGLMQQLLTKGIGHTEFKDSAVGQIPAAWSVERLGNEAYIKARIGWKGLSSEEYTSEGPYLIAGKHILRTNILWDKCDHISIERYEESPEIMLQNKDVIMTKDGTIGRVAYIDNLKDKSTINGTMMLIRPLENFEGKFIYYYFQSMRFQKIIKEKVSGSSIPHIFQRDLVEFKIPVPLLNEQRKIVDILSNIDKKIEKEYQFLECINNLKKGLMQQLLTGQVRVKID